MIVLNADQLLQHLAPPFASLYARILTLNPLLLIALRTFALLILTLVFVVAFVVYNLVFPLRE